MFAQVYAAAMGNLQLNPEWNGYRWCACLPLALHCSRTGAEPMPCGGTCRTCRGPPPRPAAAPGTPAHLPTHLLSVLPPRLVDVDMQTGSVLHPFVWSLAAFWPGLQALAGARALLCAGGT